MLPRLTPGITCRLAAILPCVDGTYHLIWIWEHEDGRHFIVLTQLLSYGLSGSPPPTAAPAA